MTTDQKKITGGLIAFAFAYDDFLRTGDFGVGLVRLFKPIISKYKGRIFDAEEISKAFQDNFGIPTSPIAVMGLIPRFKEARLIAPAIESEDGSVFVCSAVMEQSDANNQDYLKELLDNFIQFAEPRLESSGLTIEETQLRNMFLRFLANPSLFKKNENEEIKFLGDTLSANPVDSLPIDSDAAIAVVCAEYVVRSLKKGHETAQTIEQVVNGSLLSEVVLTLQSESSIREFENLSVVIDGPILLDMLGLCGDEELKYSQDLLKHLNDAGMKLLTFQHCIDEIGSIIHAAIAGAVRGEPPIGGVGYFLSKTSTNIAAAQIFERDLEQKLRSVGIDLIDFEDLQSENSASYFNEEQIDYLRNHLGHAHQHLDRRQRDADSLGGIFRLRGTNKKPTQLSESGFVFLVKNQLLQKTSTSYLIKRGLLGLGVIPPAISDRDLCGVLWVHGGQAGKQLAHEQLVSNCLDVLEPSKNLLNRVRQLLHDQSPENLDEFSALATDRRARLCLTEFTLGTPAFARADQIHEIFEMMKTSTAEKVREEEASKNKKLEQKYLAELKDKDRELDQRRSTFRKEMDRQKDARLSAEVQGKDDLKRVARLSSEKIEFDDKQKILQSELGKQKEARVAAEKANKKSLKEGSRKTRRLLRVSKILSIALVVVLSILFISIVHAFTVKLGVQSESMTVWVVDIVLFILSFILSKRTIHQYVTRSIYKFLCGDEPPIQ